MSSVHHLPGPPLSDPTPFFDQYRLHFASEILVAALFHFELPRKLRDSITHISDLAPQLGLSHRATRVLVTALRALGVLLESPAGEVSLTDSAREHLVAESPHYIGEYFRRDASESGVVQLVKRLRSNQPEGSEPDDKGVGFLFRQGLHSAMEEESGARNFTLVLAGRAKNVAPVLAREVPLPGAQRLIDVGGGTGIYGIAFLRANPGLQALIWDRPEVLKVASDFAAESGVAGRLELLPGDMFADPVPKGDVILLSNILHDWDVPECRRLVSKCVESLPSGGKLLIHDVFLDDDLGGPLPAALYSTALFCVTEGRLYSRSEFDGWLKEVGLRSVGVRRTLANCSVLIAEKP